MAVDSGRTRDGFHRPAHLRRDDRPAHREPAANLPVREAQAALKNGRRPSPVRTTTRHTNILAGRSAAQPVQDGPKSAERPHRNRAAAPVSPAPGSPVPPAEVSAQLAAEVEDAVRGAAAFVPTKTLPPDDAPRRLRHRARWAWEGRYLRTLLVLDFVIGVLAGVVAFEVRFGAGLTEYNARYVLLSALLPVAFSATLAANRAYEKRYLFVGTDEYQRVLRAGLALTAATVFVAYAAEVRIARGWFVVALPLVTFACLLGRFLLRQLLHRARKRRGACMRRVVVVGHELAVEAMTRQLCRERYHGLKVVGACLATEGHVPDVPVLGTFDQIAGAVRAARADTVLVLSCPELDGHSLRRLAWHLERDDIDLIVASTLIDVAGSRTTIRPVDGLPMLHVEHPTLTGARRLVKAGFDRVGAALLLVVASPLLAGLALAVRVESRGPVLFRQVRVGKDGREFVIFKFRTMHVDAEARLAELRHLNEVDGALFKLRNDPRVTRVGRLLRKFSLDELPQLLNVLGGSMSLVGPRPPLPEEVAVYPDDARRRLAVRPGMTGLWQVSGRSDLSWDEAVRLDLQYVENWSLSLDLVIMLRTLSAVTRGAGAY
ncbi:exopolysaccharide biosynthesis polyprenyl glycosylphosphotransferase [Dactylosporangium sucinum]|uniref:Exopolysaccharide biosynthesis polyprenyl glycosylphosphotransferase n=1 Tax=Dactylosporangium sucinum TaxID=1424081 RepID=A0A917X7U0_9ACTN|nr:sugar transferase [Dactylosporangium sucinum]GGM88044.1 exopolysaccharide biosynthesis polyprenyl glycosylphosphotransferase [Dactylosporangium sucinum]